MKLIRSICYTTIMLIVILVIFLGCSDKPSSKISVQDAEVGVLSLPNLPDAAPDVNIPLLDIVDANIPEPDMAHNLPSEEYIALCWKRQYYFCTPGGGLPDPEDTALYQQEMIIDICDDNGNPCTPSGPNDPNCSWTIVSQGECSDWLECNPEEHVVHEDIPCQLIDEETGDTTNGLQDFYCEKGAVIPAPCLPCNEEICDEIDNDCDGLIDEGQYHCESECEEGNAICVGGELVNCDATLPSSEICDLLDNDCDTRIDEDLLQQCETDCEQGVEFCIGGIWTGCTAQPPLPEQCNGLDDNCNGLVDEELLCACPPEMIGLLIPCMEEPLLCGQGFKTCECVDEQCVETQVTQCFAMCYWLPLPEENCNRFAGVPVDEVCNAFDDDCDQAIDESLFAQCYTGPEETLNIGVCLPGEMICHLGNWGNWRDVLFVEDMCLDEITPIEEDLCTGTDDNCDGLIEKVMEDTDILFIVDISGSMSGTINAVQQAMQMFSANYADQEVIQWGLIVTPSHNANQEELLLSSNLVPFQQFLPMLVNLNDLNTSHEQLLDAIYLSIKSLAPPNALPNPIPQNWNGMVTSTPSINNWNINWRQDTQHVVIVFSDEAPQSWLIPQIQEAHITQIANAADELSIYTFSNRNNHHQWAPISIGGSFYPLTANAATMFDSLMEILDETACQ